MCSLRFTSFLRPNIYTLARFSQLINEQWLTRYSGFSQRLVDMTVEEACELLNANEARRIFQAEEVSPNYMQRHIVSQILA